MTTDGSFNLEFALGRFLDRCTKLKACPLFIKLGEQFVAPVEDEVVKSLAEVFLHPRYTIPLLGCFRPLIQRIVDEVVSVLRLVSDLTSAPEGTADEQSLDNAVAEGISVVDFYVRSGRGLELHECACLAFARTLDLNPLVLRSVLNFFKFAPPPFERILVKEIVPIMSTEVVSMCLLSVRVSLRFLRKHAEDFIKLWDWSFFLDFVRKLSADYAQGDATTKDTVDIRWCAVHILSIVLKLGDRATRLPGVGQEEEYLCSLRFQEFCLDIAIEMAGLYLESPNVPELGTLPVCTTFKHPSYQQSFGFDSFESLPFSELELSTKRRRLEARGNGSVFEPFVMTSRVKKSFERVLFAVNQKRPVLLYGPSGSGKSALIRYLAQNSGTDVLSIHMDDQMDAKTLIGTYVCTEQPGEFRWQPGSLTQAVMNGFWIVLEDIDKAPSDVPLLLLPLLEGSSSFMTSHGQVTRVSDNFRLFSTVSTSECSVSRIIEGSNSLGALWRKILVAPANDEDIKNIVTAWHPNLEASIEKNLTGLCSSFDMLSLRHILKYCRRISGLPVCDRDRHSFNEAIDIFASSSLTFKDRETAAKVISRIWDVPDTLRESVNNYKPTIQVSKNADRLHIGRVSLQLAKNASCDRSRFVEISSSLRLLEKIARCVEYNEPVLLVGETGTGKTTLVQNLASWLGQKLIVLNLSQQSDIVDLLGGFKPVDVQFMCTALYNDFNELATKKSGLKDDSKAIQWLRKDLRAKQWDEFLSVLDKCIKYIVGKDRKEKSGSSRKRNKPDQLKAWAKLSMKVENVRSQLSFGGMAFTFVEGAFLTALREGEWILLDEVNLAPPEILGRLVGVLERETGSLCIAERGDVIGVSRHPKFRLFACMNPATDAGKRDLPYSFRIRFTEFFVDDVLDKADLEIFVRQFLYGRQSDARLVENIVSFYLRAKNKAEEGLQDGANQKPQYSLRSLYRALEYARKAERVSGFQRAIYDGFCMFFLFMLDGSSAEIMNRMIVKHLFNDSLPLQSLSFSSFLGKEVSGSDDFVKNYVKTRTVEKHLGNLARAIFIRRYPVLLQGPTSSGKTSLVRYLAAITGHKFVRINNHEHTDLQEYLGSYITDSSGKLVFHEGVLVKAVKNGHWIVLDELNLAPSDVLEALNRLLDDNRELFVPESRETIPAHPDFMLFATQNPPTLYGGRKMLSRAFRNRFVEVHVDEIPEDELSIILTERCQIAKSHAVKMVEVMKELQLHRQSSKVFAGKHGYVTPRDLFRWADRFRTFGKSYEDLAREGYYLLAERLRDDTEKRVVQEVLDKHLRVNLATDKLYRRELLGVDSELDLQHDFSEISYNGSHGERQRAISWTKSMWRLYFLIRRCYELREPVLLVGETGGGKTTICQLLSDMLGLKLHILNCHQYTETSDFLGGFYPIRDRSKLSADYSSLVEQLRFLKPISLVEQDAKISSDISKAEFTVKELDSILDKFRKGVFLGANVMTEDIDVVEQTKHRLVQLHQRWQAIFMWQDGPLVQAMRSGDLFLVDEISLADDSVLERLNSVLEPERKLSLAEKGGAVLEEVTAHGNFLVLATMNPGGDYGKKELSPALRNRFTEIWVPSITDTDELRSIALKSLYDSKLPHIVDPIVHFWEWFNQLQIGRTLTVRDLVSWVMFINVARESLGPACAILHGAFLVLLDGLSLGTGISGRDGEELRGKCFSFLLEKLRVLGNDQELSKMEKYGWGDGDAMALGNSGLSRDNMFGIDPFFVERGDENSEIGGFEFLAPTTRRNVLRVLRAMQLQRPVLLEGSPGVGKTSLITALGKHSGHKVVRINLSEQTDMMDLLGSDLPVESDEGMKFAWSDGILLQALKQGSWVLLDELNLAPQSVLEGLNAILDHRAQVFIPELGLTYECPPTFRVFACQNPSSQGGGRKGLPKSFLNRFTKVYVDELMEADYLFICSSLYPSIPQHLLSKLISFNRQLFEETMLHRKFGHDGSPWEFNLRDVIRSCEVIEGVADDSKIHRFLNILYVQRMRTPSDRKEVLRIYEHVFGQKPSINPYPRVQLNPHYLILGDVAIKRNCNTKVSSNQLKILPGIRQSLEVAAHCIQYQWLCILVGPPSSGKTSLIRILAELSGNKLNELHLSSATDISELLGCFEQFNAFRTFTSVVTQLERFVNEYWHLLAESSEAILVLSRRRVLVSNWMSFLSGFESGLPSSFSENPESFGTSLSKLVEIVSELKQNLEMTDIRVSWSTEDLDRMIKTVSKLKTYQNKPSVKFEWVSGMLIKAIENGEWIVLENANLCNPTVLDRINSLVEPSGTITVNECGIIDGNPVTVKPHPNFRMFLTVNPNFGEVSRAMRNRGVEIYMMEPHWLLEEGRNKTEEFSLEDVENFIALSGIPGYRLVNSMAKAHIYAQLEGLSFNVQITYLELAQWVQLFQQLLMNGNQPRWSLQISWEHIYLSALGEVHGDVVVDHAQSVYLSEVQLSDLNSFLKSGLCLPGGWPMPFSLRDFTWFSRESTVRQNCLFLEILGSQYASHELEFNHNAQVTDRVLVAGGSAEIHGMNYGKLCKMMFPNVARGSTILSGGELKFDSNLANKLLSYAVNWTIEQATENDIQLYLVWLDWFGSRLNSNCPFFHNFLSMFKEELNHPIWKQIVSCRQDLLPNQNVDLDVNPVPLLSSELVGVEELSNVSKVLAIRLSDAINSVGVLRLTYQQWHAESHHQFNDDTLCYKPFLKFLRALEEKVLSMLVGSSVFDVLILSYTQLVEQHSLFWNSFTSSQFDHLLVSCRYLVKAAQRLFTFCPNEVEVFLKESRNLDRVSCMHFYPEKSLLWVYGGHPSLPVSADSHHQQQLLLKLCDSVWPLNLEIERPGHEFNVIASCNLEIRSVALQGICMSSYIVGKHDEDDTAVAQNVMEIYQMLLRRLESEKQKMADRICSVELLTPQESFAACCDFSPEMLCTESGFSSWSEMLLIADSGSCYFDLELLMPLQKLLLILLSEPGMVRQPQDLVNVQSLLESALDYSLSSRRPPQTLLAHQKLLWTIDAWNTIDAVDIKFAGVVLEMWFWWHSYMWNTSTLVDISMIGGSNIPLPCMLIHPVKTFTVDKMLRTSFVIKDYSMESIKLKFASRSLWKFFPTKFDTSTFLLAVARLLFQQIIYTHKKSFDPETFSAIKATFHSQDVHREDTVQLLISLIGSSSHRKLKSLVHSSIQPLIKHLYHDCSPHDFYFSLGLAWLRLGGLRFHLLLSSEALDPVMKNSWKLTKLEEKISSLKLNIKVRESCKYLAGSFSSGDTNESMIQELEKLESERKRLQKKIVFRPDPRKFKGLRTECIEFIGFVDRSVELINSIEMVDWDQVVKQVCNWQETASCFIVRLSNEYADYTDITQPIQIAVYEMKLGLSLVVAGARLKKKLTRIEISRPDFVMDSIYSFMRFPRGFTSELRMDVGSSPLQSIQDVDSLAKFLGLDITLLDKLVTVSVEEDGDVSVLQLKTVMYKNVLDRIAHYVADSKQMQGASFELLNKIYSEFVHIWMEMKVQVQTKENIDAQEYKFRACAFEIEDVMEVDISDFSKHFMSDTFSEWQAYLAEGDSNDTIRVQKESKDLENEWNLMQGPLIKIISVHNELFGSSDLFEDPGRFDVSDKQRLDSFVDAYELGVKMIKGLEGLFTSDMDVKLVPEHLLRVSLEYERNFIPSHKKASKFNFYKDPSAPMLAKMVKLLVALQQRVGFLLSEREDHPSLQKLMDVIKILLDIPSSTPLAKALSGLQFLLSKVHMLREEGCKFTISDQSEPISALASAWQKLEFDCWPSLLDEVHDQYEINAAKLWFPLFSLLFPSNTANTADHDESITQSLVEFVQTSNIGEFKRRLQLLFAFLMQLSMGSYLGTYSSSWHQRNLRICYNVFGFYVQFLPIVIEQVEAIRRNIETELKELQKLCRWERIESYLSIENIKRMRQKLKKLIQKYTDMLQQPVMLVLRQEALQKVVQHGHPQGPMPLNKASGGSVDVLNSALDAKQFNEEDGFIWYSAWREKLNRAVQEVAIIISPRIEVQRNCPLYQDAWRDVWETLSRICRTTIGCEDIWKDNKKTVGKKRALSELLNLLERSGLHKHRFENMELQEKVFVQPPYDPQHLLLRESKCGVPDQNNENSVSEWKVANEYYFKSLGSVQHMLRICLKPNDGFTHEQVNRSISFLNHLIVIQQDQRAAAYRFSEHLKILRRYVSLLEKILVDSTGSDTKARALCSFAQHQSDTLNCLWQQKLLFSSLSSMLLEDSALLRTFESSHLSSCNDMRVPASKFLAFIQTFIPIIQKSKESLDRCLLGCSGAITASTCNLHPHFVPKQSTQLLLQNFETLKVFEEQVFALNNQDSKSNSVVDAMLCRLGDMFKKGKLMAEHLSSVTEIRDGLAYPCQGVACCHENHNEFDETYKKTFGCLVVVLQKLSSSCTAVATSVEPEGNITAWELLIQSAETDLNIHEICNKLLETVGSAEKLVNHAGDMVPDLLSSAGERLKHLHVALDLILSFGDSYLQDFLVLTKTVSLTTHVLANVLANLFAKGFGVPTKDEEDDSKEDKSQFETGTGMGEGAGAKDVSDQIEDEDQLLGTSKEDEEQEVPAEQPSKTDKGIEMENEFDAEAFNLSEESGEEDGEDEEDEQLDSKMGEAGSDGEIMDEKLWNKDEDEKPENKNEKYESGPSVVDEDAGSRELRAKEEDVTANASESDEPGDPDKLEKENEEIDDQDDLGDAENSDEKSQTKDEAYTDSSGLKPDKVDEKFDEEMDVGETEDMVEEETTENQEEQLQEEQKESEEVETGGEDPNSADEETIRTGIEDECGTPPAEPPTDDFEENSEMKPTEEKKDGMEQQNPDLGNSNVPGVESGSQTLGDSQVYESGSSGTEKNQSNKDNNSNLVNQVDIPSGNNIEMDGMMMDSANGEMLTDNLPRTGLPQTQSSHAPQTRPNPYRNVGDALEEWKERVKVSVDLHGEKLEEESKVEDMDTEEYGYVSQFETGTSQALGAATSDQMDANMKERESERESLAGQKDEVTEMDIDRVDSENQPVLQSAPTVRNNSISEVMKIPDLDMSHKGDSLIHDLGDEQTRMLSESLVSVNRTDLSMDTSTLSRLSDEDENIENAPYVEDLVDESNGVVLYRRYTLLTTRLSQELSEQLRLIMEPTLAGKLQGDFRTGKRINLRKVIQYIASYYRNDKIWLRRTRPNKREYQVVIAVDDSSSMSESGCGDFAIRALMTVCRAMSQLEVGQVAVASFGHKGNVRILQDFDQPFSEESGAKIISSLTFRQENTIKDKPVADLLTHLDDILDKAVTRTRQPSGNCPLEQLVLVIGDGKFNEKEELKRCVRSFLRKKRMAAFLLLDKQEESILDLKECYMKPGQAGEVKFTRYMDSFPFPYYAVLRDIEALPRTLADLLRQWFELMQSTRD